MRQTRLAEADPQASGVCPHCGAPKAAEAVRCESCERDQLRPGERLQHNWASMWLMSQEQGLWPDRSPALRDVPSREGAQEDALPLEAKRQPRAQTMGSGVATSPP